MKAMILAAGYGTRLKPLTETIPKALIQVQNISLLELAIRKLIAAGIDEIVINVHHFAEQIINFLSIKKQFGIRIETSFEAEILGTGGGLKKVADFFNDDQPFFVHNVDVISTIDLRKMIRCHQEMNVLATLAVKLRKTNRYLLVDETNLICGHEDLIRQSVQIKRQPVGKLSRLGFGGISFLSPEIFHFMNQLGNFSMIDVYLELMARGEKIFAFRTDNNYWQDVGKLNTLQKIETDLATGVIKINELIDIPDPVVD